MLRELIERVHAAPRGPQVAAVFDYDGTVISGFSATAFYARRLRAGEVGAAELARLAWATVRGVQSEEDFTALLSDTLAGWRGKTEQELTELGERLFHDELGARVHSEVWELIQAHRSMKHTVVLASSATRFQIEPLAESLGIDHVLCTEVEVSGGELTGRAANRPLWGVAKAAAVRELAAAANLDLAVSFGYSNGNEDVPLLEAVGNPVAVAPDGGLRAEAGRRDWPVLACVPRGGAPGAVDVLRTAGFYGSFAAAFGVGLGVGALRRSRKQIFELAGGIGADLGLALAGVDVRVQGSEHLWSARPCLFVFNHQSNVDAIVVMKLLRGGFTGVAKKEAKRIPGFGQLFQIADVAFVDRGNTRQAKEALQPAVRKVRDEGLSLALAPEGTRSPTPALGRFKKGAFHIAMQAGVPMVPIVLRNSGEVLWRGNRVLRAGTIDVVVHPPVRTDAWRVDTIDEHVHEVREIFARTLRQWPGRHT